MTTTQKYISNTNAWCLYLFLVLGSLSANANEYIQIKIDGRAKPYLTNTTGAIGISPTSGQYENTFANALLDTTSISSNIRLINPPADVYSLNLHGNYDDRTTISVVYLDDSNSSREEYVRFAWFHSAGIDLTFTLDPTLNPKLQIITPLEGPNDAAIDDVAGNVQLYWSALTDPSITAYRIYARKEEYPKYQLLGQTTKLSYNTGHAVRYDENGERWQYIVVGVNAAGQESFYTNSVPNLLTLTALFTADQRIGQAPLTVQFTDNSLGTVNTWSWDFDGDAVEDAASQNPVYTYTQEGIYDVTLTVTGPLGTSTQIRNGYVTVIVDSDGDGFSDLYEISLGLDPNLVDTDGDGLVDGLDGIVSVTNYPSGIDLDSDGYVDGELDVGTNAQLADTDGDGVHDGQELLDGTDPFVVSSFFAIHNGDINNDGLVNVVDKMIALRILTNQYMPTPVEQARWDVAPLVGGIPQPNNQNNVGDYVVLLRKVIGNINY